MISNLHRSPGQKSKEFESFLRNSEHLLSDISPHKPLNSVIVGDFKARWISGWSNDPTHIQRNSFSCIDLIFTDQPSLVTNNGVHTSFYSSCHHQIMHFTFNLNIVYPLHNNVYFETAKQKGWCLKKLYNWWTRTDYHVKVTSWESYVLASY